MTESDQMLTAVLDCEKIDLVVGNKSLTYVQNKLYQRMKERRSSNEPLQYIIGYCDFIGLTLSVDKRVLVPRPETEILVEKAIQLLQETEKRNKPLKILDLGTGSGNIAIALAKNITRAYITSVEISQDALDVAQHNAIQHKVDSRIDFVCKDMKTFLAEDKGIFDLIISNPPYIPSKQFSTLPLDVQQEPRLSLDGGEDGLDFYQSIIINANRLLNKGGFLLMEIGDGQREGIERLFQKYSYYQVSIFYKDYVGTERIVEARR
ncbi:Peptide chain release factor N(5)-glutamine methyltransferase [hydrothermal vent metagenome]|uniref:Peptide chain release factor N(5)-glutamine methyltransferase n=1 Tax=hydrothermal vent metagenome TaxID=652676 RepID=A0A3B1DU02_9ZZZZ